MYGPPGMSQGMMGPPGMSQGMMGPPGMSQGMGPPGMSMYGPPGMSMGMGMGGPPMGPPGMSQGFGPPGMSMGMGMGMGMQQSGSQMNLSNMQQMPQGQGGDATLLNTMLEVSIPGWLVLSPSSVRVEGPLGSGGAAAVFKGTLLDQDLVKKHGYDQVAVKLVAETAKSKGDAHMDHVMQELALMWSMNFHPNVMDLVGYTNEPPIYIITKLYEIDMFRYVHDPSKQLPTGLSLKLVYDLVNGLAAMAAMNMVHRDIKTANVLLDHCNAPPYNIKAVLCDFGLARTGTETRTSAIAMVNHAGLSPRYSAPEVFSRFAVKAAATVEEEMQGDVYSLGVIIWECLARKIPWENKSTDEIQHAVCSGTRLQLPGPNQEQRQNQQVYQLLEQLMQATFHQEMWQRPTFKAIMGKFHQMGINFA